MRSGTLQSVSWRPDTAARGRAVLDRWTGSDRAPGIAAAWFDADGIEVATAGQAGPEIEVRPDHAFAWFSVTKLVTTLTVLRTVESGELELDAPLARLVPELATGPRPTLEDLLRHQAGLPDPIPWGWLRLADDPRTDASHHARSWLSRHAPRWWRHEAPPGASPARYSNLSFMALGAVLANRRRARPEDVLQSTLRSLDIRNTELAPRSGCAAGHTRFGSPFDIAMWAAGARRASVGRHGRWRVLRPIRMEVAAAGGAVGPVADLAAFGRAWLTGGSLGLDEPLRRRALAGPGPFGLGFWVGPGVALHEGSGLGFVSSLRLDLDRKRGLAVLVNRSGSYRPEWPGLGLLVAELQAAGSG